MRKDSGFTLLELMAVIAVMAILAGVGVPSLLNFIDSNRRAAAANALVVDVQQGRNVAATGGSQVVLCHSPAGVKCSNAIAPDWSEGWIVFVDTDANTLRTADERLLAVTSKRKGVEMPSTSGSIVFKAGLLQPGFGVTVAVCIEGKDDRWIVIGPTGRPALKTKSADITCTI